MAFDFPSTPSVGDLFQDSSSGAVYRWNGYAWVGGVTGIGLQTIKETRYLTAGSFTHTRDPKSSGFGDIHLLGAMGVRIATPAWVSGQTVCASCGSQGTIGIKWKYPLPATAPVVVGTPAAASGPSGASSFDTILSAPGGLAGFNGTAATGTMQAIGGGAAPAGATGCDESYPGQQGPGAIVTGGTATGLMAPSVFLRGVKRQAANPIAATGSTQPAAAGDPGVVIVVEYLNP